MRGIEEVGDFGLVVLQKARVILVGLLVFAGHERAPGNVSPGAYGVGLEVFHLEEACKGFVIGTELGFALARLEQKSGVVGLYFECLPVVG